MINSDVWDKHLWGIRAAVGIKVESSVLSWKPFQLCSNGFVLGWSCHFSWMITRTAPLIWTGWSGDKRRRGYSYMIEQRRSWAHSNILLLPTQYFMYFFLLLNMFLQHVFLPNLFAKLFSFSYTCLTSCSYLLQCCNISASPAWKYVQFSFISKFLAMIFWVMFRSCTPIGPGWVWTLKALCFRQLPVTFGPSELLCLCCVGPFW